MCQQNVSKGRSPTFDQIAQSSNHMNINKWMVFCKQFGFQDKLPKKQIIDFFKNATNLKSQMSYQEFVNGVYNLQEASKIDTNTLIKDVLQINSQYAYRNKINNLKAQYFGPTKNFFDEVRYTQQTKNIIQQFKKREERKRQVQLQRLKKWKQQKQKQKAKNQSPNPVRKSQLVYQRQKSQHRQLVEELSNYSGIFKYKTQRANSTQASASFKLNKIVQNAKDQTNLKSGNFYANDDSIAQDSRLLLYSDPNRSYSRSLNQSPIKFQSKSQVHETKKEQIRQTLPSLKMQSIEQRLQTYMIDSDAQSDQILKQHYKNQKKGKLNDNYSRIVQEIKLKTQEKRKQNFFEDLIGRDNQSEQDNQTTYMITQYR